jgi:predicted acetyltransferase
MEIGIAQEKDREAIEWLWDYCFEKREDEFFRWFFAKHYKPENVLAGYKNGRMTTCLHLLPYRLFLRGTEIPVSYLVGLATFPEARRDGSTRLLLQAALREMRDRGHYVNILMPFKVGYYYPLQWELCYHQYLYNFPLEDLRKIAAMDGDFHLVRSDADGIALQAVYEKFVADKHGYALRDKDYWQRIIEEHTTSRGLIYLLSLDGAPAGYIFYNLDNDKITVREMAWTSHKAQQALFGFLYNHRSQVKKLEWNAPMDDLTYLRLPDPPKQVMLRSFMTGRVVDVVKALTTINYAPDISLRTVLKIQDDLAPWNNQMTVLEVFDGRGQCKPVEKGKPEFQCNIGTFSQLFFGRISAKDLHKTGKIHTDFPGNIAKLDTLFPPCLNYINEYY